MTNAYAKQYITVFTATISHFIEPRTLSGLALYYIPPKVPAAILTQSMRTFIMYIIADHALHWTILLKTENMTSLCI
jgi:hypothetical protein